MTNNVIELKHIRRVHFIGISGCSMSGLAEIMLNTGYIVTGSDIRESVFSKKLIKNGIKIYIGHKEENINCVDLVVYNAAIKEDNPEFSKAKRLGIPLIKRAELLGDISRKYDYNISIAGTHGKTTTTSMLATILLKANLDPTIHIGGRLNLIDGNIKIGKSMYFLTEACEYEGSFLSMSPKIAVILNIEDEHPDVFKNEDEVIKTFVKFISKINKDGFLIACMDDKNTQLAIKNASVNTVTYSIMNNKSDWMAKNIIHKVNGGTSYDLIKEGRKIFQVNLKVPGIHNVSNSLAALIGGYCLGCDISQSVDSISRYEGVDRRFQIKGKINDITVIDDFAHHPSEVKATLSAARNFSKDKIWCIFQPHTYSRTKKFINEFSRAFYNADNIIISDIYPAREIDKGEIHSEDLVTRIIKNGKAAIYIDDFDKIVKYLIENTCDGDLIMTIGAGDIYIVGEKFIECKKSQK